MFLNVLNEVCYIFFLYIHLSSYTYCPPLIQCIKHRSHCHLPKHTSNLSGTVQLVYGFNINHKQLLLQFSMEMWSQLQICG